MRKAKILYFHEKIHNYEFISCKYFFFEIKKDLKKDFDNKFNKKSNIDNNIVKNNGINKIKNNINENNIRIRNYIIINLIQFIIINIFNQIKNSILPDLFLFQDSNITLKIKGIGDSIIFGNVGRYNNFTGISYLKEVHINGNKQDTIKYKFHFNQTDNFVELILDDNINDCGYMFYKCSNITEINLSKYNTSNVTKMNNMLNDCLSLTSLDLSNFNTSLVTNMKFMFSGCSSLTSLDLSNFDISLVTNLDSMFRGCTSLTSLNLSNFDFSKVKTINEVFKGCENFEYINLNNFDKIKLSGNSFDYQEIFLNLPETIVICIKENDADSIFSQIKGNNCSVIDCTLDWQSKQNKIINKTGECIDSCDKGSQYKYEYNGKCYDKCEQGFLRWK